VGTTPGNIGPDYSVSRSGPDQVRARPGRPRSEQTRLAVLRATTALMHEVGVRVMTTEEIASRSGASKATIYKLWASKYAVAVEALLSEMLSESDDPDTGCARGLPHRDQGSRSRARGELRPDVDPEVAIGLVFGPAMYRLVAGHAPLDDGAADAIVDGAFRGLAG